MTQTPAELGIVIKTAPLREADLLVTLYTETLGRITSVARGARKSTRRFSGTLSILVLGRYQLGHRPKGEVWGLDAGELVKDWTHLAYDVGSHAHAGYAAELVSSLLPSEFAEPAVLPLITGLWDSLAANGPSPGALRTFELALLAILGQQPALAECAACGSFELERGALFDPGRGGVICKACGATSRGPGVRPIEPETRRYLVAASQAESPSDGRALDADESITGATRAAGRDAMIAMLVTLVGRPLRSLEYIAKLGAARRSP